MIAILAVGWGVFYFIFDETLAAIIPWTYTAAVTISLIVFALTGRYAAFRFVQLTLILLLPFLLQLALGGFVNGSAVIIWSLMAPLGALAMSGRRSAVRWFLAYVALVVIAQLLQPSLEIDNNLPTAVIAGFFVANVLAPTGVAFFALHYFVGQKDEALRLLDVEKDKSERLLLNVLPREIADALKEADQTIATRYPSISVLFADIVDFTPLSERIEAEEIVEFLNDVFSYFDSLVDAHGLEKIRTMGDSYMVAAGVPSPREDHADVLARLSLAMFDYQPHLEALTSGPLTLRVGISSGPAVAGVIGKAKFQYDVWGDTVNTASRMEAQGVPGRVQISRSTYELLKNGFECEPRGVVDIKGKGTMETWFLLREKEPAPAGVAEAG